MLNTFIDWARKVAGKSQGKDFVVRFTESHASDNPSARLDIDTPVVVARITCRDSDDYDAEVIDIETEQMLFSAHEHLQVGLSYPKQFAGFFQSIGIATESWR